VPLRNLLYAGNRAHKSGPSSRDGTARVRLRTVRRGMSTTSRRSRRSTPTANLTPTRTRTSRTKRRKSSTSDATTRRWRRSGAPSVAANALGRESLAHAVSHRGWRSVHARRSRPSVSDRREPGSAEKQREPERVHRAIVPARRRAMGASRVLFQIPYLCTLSDECSHLIVLRLVVAFASDLPL
jgi:hypothetical protein